MIFKLCGACGKTTDKDSKGKRDEVSVTTISFTDLGHEYTQPYHTECIDR